MNDRKRQAPVRLPGGDVVTHVGPDVDLDTESVRDSQGRRVDQAYVDEAVDEAREARRRGRPSLSGNGGTSNVVRARIPGQLHARFVTRVTAEGKTESEVIREALEAYLS